MTKIHKSCHISPVDASPILLDLGSHGRIHTGLTEASACPIPQELTADAKSGGTDAKASVHQAERLILEQAAKRASALIDDARRQAAWIEQRARQVGYDAGRRQAEDEQRQTLQEMEHRFQEELASLRTQAEDRLSGLESEALDLCLLVVEKILARELARPDQTIIELVRTAVDKAGRQDPIQIGISESDFCKIADRVADGLVKRGGDLQADELMDGLAEGLSDEAKRIQWRPDSKLQSGSCVVTTPAGTIDAGVFTQMANIRSRLAAVSV